MSQSFAAVVLVLWCDCHWSRTCSGGLMDQFVVCDHLAGEKHWSAETMNSWACPSKSLEYIKVLEWCTSEWISRWGLVQVYDVLCWNPVCLVLSDCWGMSDIFLTMIWFISLGKTTRISPAQSAGTPSKSFVPPLSGMSDGSTEGAWMYRGLSSSSFPQPFASLFLYSSCPLVLFPCLFCLMSGFVMPDSPLSSSLFDLLHFVTMTSILPDFTPFFHRMRCLWRDWTFSLDFSALLLTQMNSTLNPPTLWRIRSDTSSPQLYFTHHRKFTWTKKR